MKRAGIGALLGLAIFATSQTAKAAPSSNMVLIPYFTSKSGMFTALSYVYHDDNNDGNAKVSFIYYYKTDLIKDLGDECIHHDSEVVTTPNDLDTIIIDGTESNVKAVFVDDTGIHDGYDGIALEGNVEGFVALKALDGDSITAEAHIVVAATRGVYSFRALQTDDDGNGDNTPGDFNFLNDDTIQRGQSTTVMFFPEYIADTYLYVAADGGDFALISNYTAATTFSINNYVYNRSEQAFSLDTSETVTCVGLIHIKDLMTDTVWNAVKDTGGWFSFYVPDVTGNNNAVVYKLEISPTYGATVTPLHRQTYVR